MTVYINGIKQIRKNMNLNQMGWMGYDFGNGKGESKFIEDLVEPQIAIDMDFTPSSDITADDIDTPTIDMDFTPSSDLTATTLGLSYTFA